MTTSPAERVAAEVRGQLARQNKTQADLALALGMSQQAISRRLRGELPFNVDEICQAATFLQIPVIAMFEVTEKRSA